MLCINSPYTDIYFNLAAEEYLVKESTNNYCIVWQSTPSVIIGKHQYLPHEVDVPYAHNQHIQIARRFSGGGAVFHDMGNINISFIETKANPNFDVYLQKVLSLLTELGITAYADERRGIYVKGEKISGSAQSIHKNRVLFHLTLLVSSQLTQLNRVLEGSYESKISSSKKTLPGVQSVKSPVTNLLPLLPAGSDASSVKDFILRHFLQQNTASTLHHLPPEQVQHIQELSNNKYAREEWIYQKKIPL